MRVKLVVVVEPFRQGEHDGFGIGDGIHRDVIALEGPHEGFGHAVALRALDRGRERLQANIARKAAGRTCDEAGAVIGQPFDGLRQAVDLAEAVLDGGDHQVADIFALDALGGGDMAHGFTIAAVEREGDADLFAIVAADLEAV